MLKFILVFILVAPGLHAQELPEIVIHSAVTHHKSVNQLSPKYLLTHNNRFDKCVFTPEQMIKAKRNTLNPYKGVTSI